ncbi:B-cell receptor CD22-like isoform X1 [Acropora muricata]|uniref:B-cell receptor CD22-like isoform X1 n=1 Tax=Acropora muricata TaxID=159855 RepID=UPI0034E47D84
MRKLEFIIIFQVLLAFSLVYDAESQVVNITSQPPSPASVLEGQPLTLEWSFRVAKTLLRVQLGLNGALLPLVEAYFGSSIITRGAFRGRVTASRTETNATITFSAVNRIDTGSYVFAVVDTDGDSATASLQLIVQFKPEMVQFVASKATVCQGESITFNCSANSNPAVHTYQLYVNETMVNETSSAGVWNTKMTTGGVFVYKCMSNNTIGTEMSMGVFVIVNEPSSIQTFTRKVITEGSNLTVMCNPSGIPPPTVFWVKKDHGERTNGTELVFTNIHRSQSGEYTCKANNPCGDATQSVEIDVQYPPEGVQFQAGEETVCSGTTITFQCSVADANPRKLTYQLYENNVMISSGSTGVWKREMTAGGVLPYNCVVTNMIGTTMSTNISVSVNDAPSIEPLRNLTVKPGDNITLTCVVSGKPSPSVFWTHVTTGIQHHEEAWGRTNIDINTLGEYRCNASNSCGQESDKLTLAYVGGKCEEQCKHKKTCRYFGKYLCLCERGTKGALCTKTGMQVSDCCITTRFDIDCKVHKRFKGKARKFRR